MTKVNLTDNEIGIILELVESQIETLEFELDEVPFESDELEKVLKDDISIMEELKIKLLEKTMTYEDLLMDNK